MFYILVFESNLLCIIIQGNISRQEAVSMIPPMVLDVKPHHKVIVAINYKKYLTLHLILNKYHSNLLKTFLLKLNRFFVIIQLPFSTWGFFFHILFKNIHKEKNFR